MTVVTLVQCGSIVLLNASFSWMIGTLVTRFWLRDGNPESRKKFNSTLRRSESVAAGLCFVGSCGALWAATAVMSEESLAEAAGMLWKMLSNTAYGHAGLTGLALLLTVGGLSLLAHRARGYDLAFGALLIGFALSRASVSHAGENGVLSLDLAIEWIHLMLIAIWIGGVAAAGWMVLPHSHTLRQDDGPFCGYLTSLSHTATAALVGIFASGVYNAWHRLGTTDNFLGNAYGTTLIVKLTIVGVAAALGGYNKFIGFPAVARSELAAPRVTAILRIESALLFSALIAAAMLTSLQPPASY